MSGNGALVGCAVLPFVADLMVREEYRLLEPRVLEVVLMTHTVYCASAQLLALLLQVRNVLFSFCAFEAKNYSCTRDIASTEARLANTLAIAFSTLLDSGSCLRCICVRTISTTSSSEPGKPFFKR